MGLGPATLPLIVVADAGPLLHLFWVDASPWALPAGRVDVVHEVWREVERHAPRALEDARLRLVASPAELPAALSAWNLDAGEQEALSYALSKRAGDVLVLCDERQARLACRTLGLPVAGSVGLIVHAYGTDKVDRACAIQTLRDLPSRGRLRAQVDPLPDSTVAALARPRRAAGWGDGPR